MSETLSVAVAAGKDAANPTLEESAAALDAQIANGNTQTPAAPPANQDRPAWLPEKFKTGEDFAKSYEELERKLGSNNTETPNEESGEEEGDTQVGDRSEARQAADEAAKKAGLDLNALSQSYWDNGSLSDDQYASLEKAGYPKNLVNQFIAGQEAVLNARTQSVYATVGGEDNYAAMIEWAGGALSKPEIAAFNKAVNGDDMNATMLAIKGLKAQYDGQVGFEPSTQVRGQTGPKTGPASYASLAEMQADMANPKYQNDPAFRAQVEQKLARSDIF